MRLSKLYKIILGRKNGPKHDSYTNYLLDAGKNKILAKIKEESSEVIVAAEKEGRQRIIEEASDVLYHLFVLLVSQDIALEEIEEELGRRHQAKK